MTTTGTARDHWRWVADPDPHWDADRERVFASVPEGVFPAAPGRPGERLAADWWRVEDGDRVLAYGWLDDVWGTRRSSSPSRRAPGGPAWARSR